MGGGRQLIFSGMPFLSEASLGIVIFCIYLCIYFECVYFFIVLVFRFIYYSIPTYHVTLSVCILLILIIMPEYLKLFLRFSFSSRFFARNFDTVPSVPVIISAAVL